MRIPWQLAAFAFLVGLANCRAHAPHSSQIRSVDDDNGQLTAALLADQKMPLSGDALAQAPIEIRQATAGEALDAAATNALLTAFRAVFKDCRFTGVETPVFRGVKASIRETALTTYKDLLAEFNTDAFSRVTDVPSSERWARFAGLVQEMDCLGLGLGDVWSNLHSPKHRFYFRSVDETSNLATYLKDIAWSPTAAPIPENDTDGNYLRSMASAFEFIDFIDILVNFVPGAPMIHPRQNRPVWQVYDYDNVTNIDSWRQAQSTFAGQSNADLKALYGIISRRMGNFTFRERAVVGGGDLEVPATCSGMRTWRNDTKFFRATRRQVAVLRSNPLVATQWCDDGADTGDDVGVIAQYEYPSARTYAFPVATAPQAIKGSQPARLDAFLSAGLKASLDAAKAEGKLNSEDTPEFKALTRAMVEELVAFILKDWSAANNHPGYAYQLLMSTHPSDDYNGRSLRAWYKFYESRRSPSMSPAGIPLFLTDFNLDLFSSPEEFLETSIVQARTWSRVLASFVAARAAGRPYIDAPFPWALAADCDGTDAPDEVVKRVRAWMNNEGHLNLVRTKQKFDVDLGLKAAVADLCNP